MDIWAASFFSFWKLNTYSIIFFPPNGSSSMISLKNTLTLYRTCVPTGTGLLFKPIQDGSFRGCSWMAKAPPSLKSVTQSLQR